MNTQTLMNLFNKEDRKKVLEAILAEMMEATLEYEKVEYKSVFGNITFEVNKKRNSEPTVKSIVDEIKRRYEDNIKAVESCGDRSPNAKAIFGSAAKEDYDLLAFIEYHNGKLNSFIHVC